MSDKTFGTRTKNAWKKFRHTISYKLSIYIVILMALSLLIISVLSGVFGESFYTQSKQRAIKEIYDTTYSIGKKNGFTNSNSISRMTRMCEKNSASVIIVNSQGQVLYAFGQDDSLRTRYRDVFFGNNLYQNENNDIIEQNDKYKLQSTIDKQSGLKYYELTGQIDQNNFMLIRISVENFKESISITNRFYLILGIPILIILTILIILLTRRYTVPLLKLSRISKKMSNLDFDTKYEGPNKDEIGELGESMNEMSDKLETTITELKEANIELAKDIKLKEEIDEARKEFISNVSHELKTPIAIIQGYAEGLQDGVLDNPEDMKYYCSVISDEANKMNQMVKGLLELNKLENGNIKMNIVRFDIVSVAKAIINRMGMVAKQKDVEIKLEAPESVDVWADEFQIEEVIMNYLNNAFNHVDDNKNIKVEITPKNDIVRVAVFNSGQPIPEESLEHIWDKFYKVDKARTREYGGSGIGLSIVKATMDAHDQKCGVENKADGVKFWFELDAKNN